MGMGAGGLVATVVGESQAPAGRGIGNVVGAQSTFAVGGAAQSQPLAHLRRVGLPSDPLLHALTKFRHDPFTNTCIGYECRRCTNHLC